MLVREKKITDSPLLITRSTIWCAGEPDMEPPVSATPQANGCHDDNLPVQQLPAAKTCYDEDDSDEEFLPTPDGGMIIRSESWERNPLRIHLRQSSDGSLKDESEKLNNVFAVHVKECPPVALRLSHRRERSSGGPEDEPTPRFDKMTNAPMPDAEQVRLIGQNSSAAPAARVENLGNTSELDIRMIVMATVARAVTAGAIEAALSLPANPAASMASAARTDSAMGHLHDAPGELIVKETTATFDAPKVGPSEFAPAANNRRANKIPTRPLLNLKALAWCCK
jgi:hypothetical protein